MSDTEETLSFQAIALDDDAPGPCGLTLALVKQTTSSDMVWVLDPEDGLMDRLPEDRFHEAAGYGVATLLEEPVAIGPGCMALYLHRDFLELYDSFFPAPESQPAAPGYGLPDAGHLPAGRLRGSRGRVLFGSKAALQVYGQEAASALLYRMDQSLVQLYTQDPQGFPLAAERMYRSAVLLAATNRESRTYLDFHRRIAAAISLQPGEHLRGEWIFDNMVQPHHPRFETFHAFLQEARGIREDWAAQAAILKPPPDNRREEPAKKQDAANQRIQELQQELAEAGSRMSETEAALRFLIRQKGRHRA